jgi:hypothetical protein
MGMERLFPGAGRASALVLGAMLAGAGAAAGAVATESWRHTGSLLSPELLWAAEAPEAEWMAELAPAGMRYAQRDDAGVARGEQAGTPPQGGSAAPEAAEAAGPAPGDAAEVPRIRELEERFFRRFGDGSPSGEGGGQ